MKKICILCMCITFVVCLTGCKKNKWRKYNAKVISEGYVFNETFLLDNKTYGSYLNGYYIEDESYPKERVIIVNNEEYFQEVFDAFPDIDFNKEMIVLHGFTTSSNGSYEIKSMDVKDRKLSIEYRHHKKSTISPPDASKPDTKWFIVKLNYMDICSVEFKFVK